MKRISWSQKSKAFKNGLVTIERMPVTGMFVVRCWIGSQLHDKVTCDTSRQAHDYYRAFANIARKAA